MNTRLRRDSTESQASLWEKFYERIPQTQQGAPFADEESNNSLEQNPITNEPEDDDTDLDASASTPRTTEQDSPWIKPTAQKHLRIILKGNENIKEISNDIRKDLKWSDEEQEIRPWYFGLTSIRLNFTQAKRIDLHMLPLASRHPFWLKLKTEKQKIIRNTNTNKKPRWHMLTRDCAVALRYGALTDLNQFTYSSKHTWENDPTSKEDSTWFLHLDNQRPNNAYIQWEIRNTEIKRRKQLFVNNINNLVIVDLDDEGFNMYICQKFNISEFEAPAASNNTDKRRTTRSNSHHSASRDKNGSNHPNTSTRGGRSNSRPRRPPPLCSENNINHDSRRISYENFHRVGIPNGCYFPDVQFSLHITPFSTSNNNKRNKQSQVNNTLSILIEFLLANNITFCYGKINVDSGAEPYLFFEQPMPSFPSLIMKYSWQMLSVLGYRLQLQIDAKFKRTLNELHRTEPNYDELFYRVCVYLSRIFSIKPFADINQELQHAIRESKRKRDQAAYGLVRKLDTADPNEAYIPSVTITPTTIRIKPLKLCRTNRVLRENQQFGTALEHFVLVDIRDENGRDLQSFHFRDLRERLLNYLVNGFSLMDDDRQYTYLHHSQSQLRERQFWFYHHENNGSNLSSTDAYRWMGTFDKEKNPAKHAARIALCFSTTRAAVQVPVKRVLQIDDIKTTDGRYTFTDGCGTMSKKLRNQIKKKLHINRDFSAVQFRYDGAKGVVSLHLNMSQDIDLLIRDSMKKFESQHDTFEVCKLSAPRPLYLNRQAILLLSYRQIPETSFLILQQRNHLQLVRALLRNTDAEKLILHKVPSWFLPRDIHRANLDYIHEPFFRQLLISACVQSTRELLQRTRIRIPPNEGRNMMGIVDEYGVLEPNEVYIQYTTLTDEDADDDYSNEGQRTKVLEKCQVVITKNPCHHPGDIRTFTAVNRDQLSHLQDVIVFSQKGSRPAPHDISGSDLDGDEYSVIWHKDLVPSKTENADPYDYDANIPSKRYDKPVERDVINKTVLEIAENDYLGRLSNLHLAFADKFGVDDRTRRGEGVLSTVELAGAISLEVDSGKTGYHPLNDEKIKQLNSVLENKRPDYMDNPNFEQYPSEHVLGKLYRSSKRTIRGWNRLIRYHRHLRHLEVRMRASIDEEEQPDMNSIDESNIEIDVSFRTGVNVNRAEYSNCVAIAKELDYVYRQEILEILNLYGLSHESDLWCRNSVNGSTGELEDTAYTELEQLVKRTRDRVFLQQTMTCESGNCDIDTLTENLCNTCKYFQKYIAIACYETCYEYAQTSEQAPVLSLPWLFATPLLTDRTKENFPPAKNVLGIAMQKYLDNVINKKRRLYLEGTSLKYKTSSKSKTESTEIPAIACAFIEVLQYHIGSKNDPQWSSILNRFVREELLSIRSTDECQLIHKSHKRSAQDNEYVAILLSILWTRDDDEQMHKYFDRILNICFDEAHRSENAQILDNSEAIILLLQKMAIGETVKED